MTENNLSDGAYEARAKALMRDLAKTMLIFVVLASGLLIYFLR